MSLISALTSDGESPDEENEESTSPSPTRTANGFPTGTRAVASNPAAPHASSSRESEVGEPGRR